MADKDDQETAPASPATNSVAPEPKETPSKGRAKATEKSIRSARLARAKKQIEPTEVTFQGTDPSSAKATWPQVAE